jgi:hypothetical protein
VKGTDSNDIKKLIKKCYKAFFNSDLEEVSKTISFLCELTESNNPKLRSSIILDIATFYIDFGSYIQNNGLIQKGIDLLETNYNNFMLDAKLHEIEYYIGNGYKGLYDVSYLKIINNNSDDSSKINPQNIKLLIDAKQHYWKAIKSSNKDLTPQYCVNLANCLDGSCRIYESLIWYNKALKLNSNFGMAYLNKGLALDFLRNISGTFTIKLLNEIKTNFEISIKSKEVSKSYKEQAEYYKHQYEFNLLSLGYDEEKIKSFDSIHSQEYNEHSEFWKWCLENYLVLSEHSLYCKCVGSRRDDLSIAKQAGSIGGFFIPVQENLLNHIKSEFCLARALYYQAITKASEWNTKEYEGCFSELYIGEMLGMKTEFLKTSFRLCFGILDKIARGVSNQFNLATFNEDLYFDSFWRPQVKKDEAEVRWNKINDIRNLGFSSSL